LILYHGSNTVKAEGVFTSFTKQKKNMVILYRQRYDKEIGFIADCIVISV
jgi:hypothetical protein